MNKLDDFIVSSPYQPNKLEKETIKNLEEIRITPLNWESQKKGIKSFKEHIKDHMYKCQNYRCAYCRMEIPLGDCNSHRDHITPKISHPEWTFTTKNICITCPQCNTYKGDKEVLTKIPTNKYPSSSNDFKIINPFLDRYSEHIKIEDDIIYKAITDKGKFTIEACKLSRPDLAINRAWNKMRAKEDPNSILSKLLSLLSADTDYDKDNKKYILKEIKDRIKMYKENK